MLHTHTAFLALVSLFALGGSGCAVEADVEEDTTSDSEAVIVLPHPFVYGTYRRERQPHASLGMEMLVLKADGTYHRSLDVLCVRFPCEPVKEDGTFLLRGTQGDLLSLYPDTHARPEYYHVTFAHDTMLLRGITSRETVTLVKTPTRAWCEEPRDCTLQRLPHLQCTGFWSCGPETETCSYGCLRPF